MAAEIDEYAMIAEETRVSIRVQRSEFIGVVFGTASEPELQEHLRRVVREFHDATHHCWAFRIFAGGSWSVRASDAGEPSGTAGKPILTALEANRLWDSAIIVARYFGGIKLGTGGLSRAYRQAAQEAVAQAPTRRRILYQKIEVIVPFESIHQVFRIIAPPDIVLSSEDYGDRNRFILDIRRSRAERMLEELRERRMEARL
ncbi:MAG TPA: YigZ family protein, partial [Thermoanaerobaculia bacterium]|nr:YigZ family protein [Thermoanaerobaculia bacterium]